MKQYKSYPIFINYNLFTEKEREESERKWLKKYEAEIRANPKLRQAIEKERAEAIEQYGGYSEYRLAIKQYLGLEADRALDEIRREKSTPESLQYEAGVTKQLDIIHTTAIGKLLFKSMKATEKVWIVPTDNMEVEAVAATSPAPLSKAKGGGIRVHYDPVEGDSPNRYYAADDVLFHELVHAYRAGRWTKSTWRYEKLKEYESEEEFLAVYMTNVYRACRGDLSFYRTHINSELVSKERIYDYLSTDAEAFYALKYFTENDKLAMQVAKFAVPLFNPWRDFTEIGKRFWKDYGRIGKKAPHLIDL